MLNVGLLLVSAVESPLQLREAQARSASAARAAFAKIASPEMAPRPWDLAALIAAEEHHSESPETIRAEMDAQLDELAQAADARLRFARLLPGGSRTAAATKAEPSAEVVATAVSTTLFGARGALDDDDIEGYFRGNSIDYYDPRNSYVDMVLMRRQGIPITLSLVRMHARCETADRLSTTCAWGGGAVKSFCPLLPPLAHPLCHPVPFPIHPCLSQPTSV
jgi:hypothetical protein